MSGFYMKCNTGLKWVNLPLKCVNKLMGSTGITITHHLTLSCIMLKNCQTYFKNLAM